MASRSVDRSILDGVSPSLFSFVCIDAESKRIVPSSSFGNVPFCVGDGSVHPISDFTGTGLAWANLAAVQVDYPFIPGGADLTKYDLFSCALQSAINAMSTRGGGNVTIPPGVYVTSQPIIGASNVGIVGQGGRPRYGTSSTSCPVKIKTSSVFPTDGIVLDLSTCTDTHLENLEVVGNGSATPPQTDATSIGLWLGNKSGGTGYARHSMQRCSFRGHKYGIKNLTGDYCWWKDINVGDNWYCNIYFDNYGGNDGTYEGVYINTSNYNLTGGSDPLNDVFPGVGLYLGIGCSNQSWIGGKIEYCGTGIVMEQAFGNHFTSIMFDANSKWHVRLRSGTAPDDIATLTNLFTTCRFNGGAWSDFASSIGAYNGHVFIEGQKTGFYPTQVSAMFTGCSFKAAVKTSIYGENVNDSVKYPTDNVVATRVIGSGSGKPELSLVLNGCDCRGAAQWAGTCNTASGVVTRLTGQTFTSMLVGRTIRLQLLNPYAITGFTDGTHVPISETPTLSGVAWSVDVNQLPIDSNFTASSEVRVVGCRGMVDYTRQSVNERIPLAQIVDSAGAIRSQVAYDVTTIINAILSTYGMVLARDVSGVFYLERYTSGYGGSVLDFGSHDATNQPTFASLRLAGSERARLLSTGVAVPNQLGIGQSTTDSGYQLAVNGPANFKDTTIHTALSATRTLKIDGSGFVQPGGKISITNSSDVDVTGITDGKIIKRSGSVLADGSVLAADIDASALLDGGYVRVVAGAFVTVSVADMASDAAANIAANALSIAQVNSLAASLAAKADHGGGTSGALSGPNAHSHTVT